MYLIKTGKKLLLKIKIDFVLNKSIKTK